MTFTTARDEAPLFGSTMPAAPLLIDRFVDAADATIAAHAIVAAPPAVTYEAARTLDLLEVRTPLSAAAFAVRGIPEKVLGRPSVRPPAQLRLDGDVELPGWMILGQEQDRELVFGAVGVFWTPTIRWNTGVTPETFAAFNDPGWGKIACNYATLPYGNRRTLLTYECRTAITDDDSRRRFDRYWWLIRPFVHHIMDATVRTIAEHAEHAEREGTQR